MARATLRCGRRRIHHVAGSHGLDLAFVAGIRASQPDSSGMRVVGLHVQRRELSCVFRTRGVPRGVEEEIARAPG